MKTPRPQQTPRAKHLTRLRAGSSKKKVVIVYLWHLTKEVRSCKGPPDGSCLVYPYPSPQCLGGLGNSPVVIRFNRDFGGVGLMRYENPIHNRPKTTTKTNLSGLNHSFLKGATK